MRLNAQERVSSRGWNNPRIRPREKAQLKKEERGGAEKRASQATCLLDRRRSKAKYNKRPRSYSGHGKRDEPEQ